MIRRGLLFGAFLAAVLGILTRTACSQTLPDRVCGPHPSSLYCLPYQNNLFGYPVGQSPFSVIFSAVGSQLSLLPLASPASGISLIVDPRLHTLNRSSENLGTILSERANTLGLHRLFIGFSYQRFGFDNIDGVSLKNFPLVVNICSAQTVKCGPSVPGDVNATTNRVDLKIDQFTMFASYGLTSRIDVSIAVPVENVRLGISRLTSNVLQGNPGDPGLNAPVFGSAGASGIGDVLVRGKGVVWPGEKFGVAAGADLRIPTGDELNFLGSGAWGINPFVTGSYQARFSPHIDLGYQWNSDSILAATSPSTGVTRQLPTNIYYVLGFDFAATKKFTVVGDFRSSRIFDALRFSRVTPFGQPSVALTTGSLTTSDAAIGFKVNPTHNLLLTANADFKLDHNGLRHRPIPLVGASYTF